MAKYSKEIESQASSFLRGVIAAIPSGGRKDDRRPERITLTWAQSLDAKIAGPNGAQVAISGKESLIMTH